MHSGWIIFGVIALLSWLVSMQLKSKFKQFSAIPVNYGITGKQVAERMLADNGIYDVKVVSVEGSLFSFITLPVEINASQRALAWLTNAGITSYSTFPQAKSPCFC